MAERSNLVLFNVLVKRVALVVVSLLPAPLALSQNAFPSYTPEQLRENARSFLAVREKKQSVTAEMVVNAAEFKGYVTGVLDARTGAFDPKTPDANLSECVSRNTVVDIAHRTAVGIVTGPLNRSLPAADKLALSLYIACDESLWQSSK